MTKQYWLMKSEPDCFSIDDLQVLPNQTTPWDGVRNYQARNFMRDEMQPGDLILFYHSNCKPPGIAGVAEVSSHAYPDFTAFDPESEHPDPKSTADNPRWYVVDVCFKRKFPKLIPLEELKRHEALENMPLVRKGNRLSVMPVTEEEWEFINELAAKM